MDFPIILTNISAYLKGFPPIRKLYFLTVP